MEDAGMMTATQPQQQQQHGQRQGAARLALLLLVPPGKCGTQYLCAALHSFLSVAQVTGVMVADTDAHVPASGGVRSEVAAAIWFCVSHTDVSPHDVRLLPFTGTPDKAYRLLVAHAQELGFTHGLLARSTEVLRMRSAETYLNPVPQALVKKLEQPASDVFEHKQSEDQAAADASAFSTECFTDPLSAVRHTPMSWMVADAVQVATNMRFKPQADVLFRFESMRIMGAVVPAPVPMAPFRKQLLVLPWENVVIEMLDEEELTVADATEAMRATSLTMRTMHERARARGKIVDPLTAGFLRRQLVWAQCGIGNTHLATLTARLRLRSDNPNSGSDWGGDDGYYEALLCVSMLLRRQAGDLHQQLQQASYEQAVDGDADAATQLPGANTTTTAQAQVQTLTSKLEALEAQQGALLLEASELGVAFQRKRLEGAVMYAAHLQRTGCPATGLALLAGLVSCLSEVDTNPWLGDPGIVHHGLQDVMALCAADAKSPAAASLLRTAAVVRRGRGDEAGMACLVVGTRYGQYKTDSDTSPLRQALRDGSSGPWLPSLVVHDDVVLPAGLMDPDAAMTIMVMEPGTVLADHAWLRDVIQTALGVPARIRMVDGPTVSDCTMAPTGVIALASGYAVFLCLQGDGCVLELVQLVSPPWREIPHVSAPLLGDIHDVATFLHSRSTQADEWRVVTSIDVIRGRMVLVRAGQFLRVRMPADEGATKLLIGQMHLQETAVPSDHPLPTD